MYGNTCMSISAVVIHYEEALYRVYGSLPLPSSTFVHDANFYPHHPRNGKTLDGFREKSASCHAGRALLSQS